MRLQTKILIAFLLIVSSYSCNDTSVIKPHAVNGILDLRNYDINQIKVIDLDGEWEFYWQKQLLNSDFQSPQPPKYDKIVAFPSLWNGLIINNKELSGYGYATYRLQILQNPINKTLALKIPTVATSLRVFVNDNQVELCGIPGLTREQTTPEYHPQIVTIPINTDTLNVILHISNFHHRKGGTWESFSFGYFDNIQNQRNKTIALEYMIFGCILIIGLYHFGLYIIRRNDKSPLYFAIFCIALIARISVTGEHLVNLIPNFPWEPMVKIEYISFYAAVPLFLLFMRSLYPTEIHKIATRGLCVVGGLFILSALVLPARYYSYGMPFFQGLTLLLSIYSIYALILTVRRKRDGSLLFSAGWVILFATVINDILYQNEVINSLHLSSVGVVGFIFFKSFLLSKRFSESFKRVEILSKELDNIVKNQEQIINERTSEIVNQQVALERANEKFRSLFEKSSIPQILLTDVIIDFNKAACELFQYCEDKIINKKIEDFFPKNPANETTSLDRFYGYKKRALDNEQVFFEFEIDRSGKNLPVMIRFNKVQINGFSILLTIIQDLTEQKEAEAKIKQAHRDLMSANQEVLLNYLQLEKQQEEIIIHKNQIEAKNRDITASLNYASRIQKTILPPARFVEKTLPEHFIFYQPREIVSGDFYWIRQIDDFIIIAVADCTGHGVPGAFMSMLSATLLNEIVSRNSVLSHPQQANEILNELREQIKTSLRQTGKEGESQDGLDIALCVINPQNHSLQYAGANSPLYLVRDNTLIVYKPDRNPIGIYLKERPFALNQFQYKSNDIIYLCTDGFADQIGGEIERKFLSNRLRRFLLSISQNPMPVQRDLLKQELDNWMYINHETKPPYEQIDDVLLIGVKLQFASAVRSTRRKYNWQSKTILMAEDEEFSYQLLKEAVHNTEVNLIWASNGEEALELYRKNENINLLLLDIQMPIMNGYEVINKIRETNKSIPIIIFTALAALGEKEKGFSSGCDDYIYKPLHVPELLATLNKYLG